MANEAIPKQGILESAGRGLGGIFDFITSPSPGNQAVIAERQLSNQQRQMELNKSKFSELTRFGTDPAQANQEFNAFLQQSGQKPVNATGAFQAAFNQRQGSTVEQAQAVELAPGEQLVTETPRGKLTRKKTAKQSTEDISATLANINASLGPESNFEVGNITVSEDGGFNIKLGRKEPQQELINQLVEQLGPGIVAGTATPEEIKQFNQAISALSGRASTNVTVNTSDTTPQGVTDTLDKFRAGQRELQEFTNDPANATFVQNMDFSVKTNSKGFLETEIKPKKTIGSEAIAKREIIEDVKGRLVRIGEIMKDPDFFSKVGPIEGRVTETKAKLIGGDPTGAELRRLLDSLIIWVYGLSGKAITEPERVLLKSLQPQITDPDDTFVSNFFGYLNDIKSASGLSDELWQELGFRSGGKPRPEVQKAVRVFSDQDNRGASELSEKELRKIAGGQ